MDHQKFVNYINSFFGFNRHNNIKLVELGEGYALVETPLTRDSMNPQGSAHGGLIYTLADTAAGCACISHGRMAVTLDGNVNYLHPGKGSCLRAAATEQHYGKRTALYRVEITDDAGKVVALANVTYSLSDKTFEL